MTPELCKLLEVGLWWTAADLTRALGSVAEFKKLKGKRQNLWDKCHQRLWPREKPGDGMATVNVGSVDFVVISTQYMMAVTLWGFSQPRKPHQREAARAYLADLVGKVSLHFPSGFLLNIPGLEAPLKVDQHGCLDRPSWYSLVTPGCPGPEATHRRELAAYIVMALTPENEHPEFWERRGAHLLSQLANLVNQTKPGQRQAVAKEVPAVPAAEPQSSSTITDASAASPLSDDETDSWIESLTSVAQLLGVLEGPGPL